MRSLTGQRRLQIVQAAMKSNRGMFFPRNSGCSSPVTSRPKKVFDSLYSDLYEPDYWDELQHKIRNGYVADVFPYGRKQRIQQRKEGVNSQGYSVDSTKIKQKPLILISLRA